MTREKFDALVAKLEARAKASPSGFTARTGALAVLGYAYMLGVLLLTVSVTLGLVALLIRFPNWATIKFGLVGLAAFGGMGWALLKALWVRMSAPEGVELRHANVPALFQLIDGLRAELKSPEFHHVLLVGDYNAAVVQVPRLGVFGWHRNYLLLGLPLMQGLGPEEFRAVLAHEFGHLSGNHGRFGNWIYRLRRTWERVFEELARQRPGKLAVLLTGFLNWFWPKFNAHAFVLSRANEYEADAIASQLAGAEFAASALQRVKVHSAVLEEKFWPEVFKMANREPEPPRDLYFRSATVLRDQHGPEETARWLRAGFQLLTNNADTHPCLRDRLQSLGALPSGLERGEFPRELPAASSNTAAEVFLAGQLDALAQQLGEQWRAAMTPGWQQRHREADELRQQLAGLDTGSAGAPAHPDELWKKAQVLVNLEGDRSATPLLDQILSIKPDHVGACFVRGREYLEADDPRGVELIERAMNADASWVPAGCDLLYGHYARTGQRDKLRPLEHRLDAHQELENAAQQERANIRATDTFLAHGLTVEQIAHIRDVMASDPDVAAAHVARKQVKVFPESPRLVIGVKPRVHWWKPRSSGASQKLINRLSERLQLPGYVLVFAEESDLKSLAKAVAKTPESLVYQANE